MTRIRLMSIAFACATSATFAAPATTSAPTTARANAAAQPGARTFAIVPDVATGVYASNQPVTWSIDWTGNGAPPAATYSILAGQVKSIGEGPIEWQGTHASVKASLAAPGTALLKVTFEGIDKPGLGGVVVAPEQIPLAAPRPADFDAFWDAKLAELAAVAPDVQLTPMDSGKPGIDYWQVTMSNVRGIKIRGQLARPHGEEKLPAQLMVQWAGVYGLPKNWVVDRAAAGYVALNISAHDIPIDQPPEFYRAQSAGPLKDYWMIGNEDRDQSYFLHMYLSCYRAAEYLTQRPDWNGKTLVVVGGSQGGQQALLTAALHPAHVTAALADVPAGCDFLGPTVDRKDGWPQWYGNTWGGRDAAKVHEASRYYDIANFAPRIRCPVVIGAGLLDQTCPPAGILAAANQIPVPKRVVIFPFGEHQDVNKSHGEWNRLAYSVWLPSLAKDVVPPLND